MLTTLYVYIYIVVTAFSSSSDFVHFARAVFTGVNNLLHYYSIIVDTFIALYTLYNTRRARRRRCRRWLIKILKTRWPFGNDVSSGTRRIRRLCERTPHARSRTRVFVTIHILYINLSAHERRIQVNAA